MPDDEELPLLPPELERYVFEIAVLHHPQCMRRLLPVARRVRIWIEPILYRSLTIYGIRTELDLQDPPFRYLMRSAERLLTSKPASFFQATVRQICFPEFTHVDRIIDILSVCSGTTSLSLAPQASRGGTALLDALSALPLQRLSAFFSVLFRSSRTPFTHALFAHITHIEFHDWRYDGWDAWTGLVQVPHLTHLAFYVGRITNEVCVGTLTHCTRLAALVLRCERGESHLLQLHRGEGVELVADPRFVMISVQDRLLDWQMGGRGGRDFWAEADELIVRRRAGLTAQYYILDS
ncbi:hypothetical protein FB45DRAFT_75441 [Roridomyces roridus]|uniref:Uncharacterized protein n=1 Tax=Roridomyces roridus TaxID=1738132 RepID=A0AAD7BNV7_9AGAR|nr:hypothetical protein FB45DRAFT_75441 [Roridomyces roridus]